MNSLFEALFELFEELVSLHCWNSLAINKFFVFFLNRKTKKQDSRFEFQINTSHADP